METTQVVQELKAERVQEELAVAGVAAEPWSVSLKAERVQSPAIFGEEGGEFTAAFEMSLHQAKPVTIEFVPLGIVITVHEAACTNNPAGAAEAPGPIE